MRKVIAVLAALLLGSASHATTLRVDGPGDGDGQNGDEFDTISLAANALLASNEDGVPDRIEIVVDQLTGASFDIFNTALPGDAFDDFTLDGDGDGNGVPCLMITVSSSHLRLTAGQTATLENFIRIPDNAAGFSGGLVAYTTSDAVGATLNLRNITLTASAPGNTPVDPDGPFTAGAVGPSSGWAVVGEGLSEIELHVANVTAAHTTGGFLAEIVGHGITAEIISCEFLNSQNGISVTPCSNETVLFEDCLFAGQQTDLMTIGGVQEGTFLDLTFGPGCVFGDSQGNGIRELDPPPGEVGGGEIAVRFTGTADNPIVVEGGRGLYSNLRAVNTLESVEHLHAGNNELELFNIASDSIGETVPRISDCLFVADSALIDGSGVFVIDVTQDQASLEPVVFERCTFHDGTTALNSGYNALTLTATGASAADVLITDCIFSGRDDRNAVAALNSIPSTVRLERCAVAQEVAVETLQTTTLMNVELPSTLLLCDPAYVDTDFPPGVASFNVREEMYALRPYPFEAISGWAEFVGGIEACTTSIGTWDLWR